ncbi:MAG: hypothetical protein GX772_12180 [Alcaligenaceae bacterium]|nr:hypothetical protein [Alcaligenaceae bacterium]
MNAQRSDHQSAMDKNGADKQPGRRRKAGNAGQVPAASSAADPAAPSAAPPVGSEPKIELF